MARERTDGDEMTSPERLEQLDVLRAEWEAEQTTDGRRAEIAAQIVAWATEEGMDRCVSCKNSVAHLPHPTALAAGHIATGAGLSEFRLSQLCEFCFDRITAEPDEPDDSHGLDPESRHR